MQDWPNKNFFKKIVLVLATITSIFYTSNALAQKPASTYLFFSTPPAEIKEGERVTINVKINSLNESINAISGVFYFPSELIKVISISKEKTIMDLWTQEPKLLSNRILFEGVILNPGFQSTNGLIFNITFEARNKGIVKLNWGEGAVLANDGRGTNVLTTFKPTSFKIIPGPNYFENKPIATPVSKPIMIPVITKYFPSVGPKESLLVKGKGEPFALTKIVFKNYSVKSLGERFMDFLRNKKEKLSEVLVTNDQNGIFYFISSRDLIAGAYYATPFLVNPEQKTETPGISVKILVNDSDFIKKMIILLNIMCLLVPFVILGVIIYFIPWYSWRKMRLIKGKMLLEEEKIDITAEELRRKSKENIL